MKDALHILAKDIKKTRSPQLPLPSVEDVEKEEEFEELEGERMKIFCPIKHNRYLNLIRSPIRINNIWSHWYSHRSW